MTTVPPDLGALYLRHRDAMHKAAVSVLREMGRVSEAADAVNDAIISIMASPPRDVRSWEAFLVTAAKRKALDRVRSADVRHAGPEFVESIHDRADDTDLVVLPAACDTPTAAAASSLDKPFATSRQNSRSTSRRSEGFPGDFIGERPVNSFIHPAGLPINTSMIEVLRRPVETANYASYEFATIIAELGIRQSVGRTGICYDNAMADSFFAALKNERVHRTVYSHPRACAYRRCPLHRVLV